MTIINRKYLEKLSAKAFDAIPIRRLDQSLFQVGTEKVVITASAPTTDDYVFGVDTTRLAKAQWVVLGAENHGVCFKLPVSIFTMHRFSEDAETGRKITTVHHHPILSTWHLTCKKGPAQLENKLPIGQYKVELMDDQDRIAFNLGLQAILGLR